MDPVEDYENRIQNVLERVREICIDLRLGGDYLRNIYPLQATFQGRVCSSWLVVQLNKQGKSPYLVGIVLLHEDLPMGPDSGRDSEKVQELIEVLKGNSEEPFPEGLLNGKAGSYDVTLK